MTFKTFKDPMPNFRNKIGIFSQNYFFMRKNFEFIIFFTTPFAANAPDIL
jgi:hypothetical protein